jgi:GLPGLI family protein
MVRLLTIVFLLLAHAASAQFIGTGTITYERRVNLQRQYGDDIPDFIKQTVPKFQAVSFTLAFTEKKSLYTPGEENTRQPNGWMQQVPGLDNTVYQEYDSKMVTAGKQVYEQRFFIHDSMRKLNWRVLPEERNIAGYQCRKAVTRICDSVYVVAFYAYDIPISGGPEQFGGLPGMILELAVPRLYATWIAAAVHLVTVSDKDIQPVSGKGKTVNQQQLMKELSVNISNKDRWRIKTFWWSSL